MPQPDPPTERTHRRCLKANRHNSLTLNTVVPHAPDAPCCGVTTLHPPALHNF
ncbi:hypothetical protein [Deinococcus maricopensis]|uniref:hypothetical protein n=1 Tax=Deinococcus maricopensis TaxID=309887 RepID=UPI0002F53A94|nr:hypothetical protein [Deinococcus maricopensis]